MDLKILAPILESLENDLFPEVMKEFMFDIEKFELGKNDKDRVKLVLNDIDGSFRVTRECPHGKKSSEESEKFRYSGNLLLNSSSPDLEEVLKHYSKSILYAPPGSEQLSLAYANRSTVLFRGEYYEECLEDISRALKAGYPDSLKPKLLIRRVTCNYALTGNVNFETDEGLIEARALIEKLPATNKMRLMIEEILNNPGRITSVGRKVKKIGSKYQPEMKGRSAHLPGASDAIALRYSEEFGRHLVATREIKSGEVLLIERPYAITVPDEWIYCICSHCARRTWNGIPCDYCIHAMFCSDECKCAAWLEYHDVECEVLGAAVQMIGVWDQMFMGLRITVKAIREAGNLGVLRKRLEELDSVKASDVEISINPNAYETFYVMSDNPERYELKYLALFSAIAVRFTYLLAVRTNLLGEKETGDLRLVKDSEKLLFVAGLMLRNIRIARNRVFAMKVENKEKTEEDQILMLLPVYSFFNGRCYDFTQLFRFDEDMALVTPVPISKGDQVFTRYCPDYKQTPRDLRRKVLNDRFQFICHCLACKENWSDLTSTWNYRNSPREIMVDLLEEMIKFEWVSPEEIRDPMELIPIKENFCKSVDFLYSRVTKPCVILEELVAAVNQLYSELSSTAFPRFIDKLQCHCVMSNVITEVMTIVVRECSFSS